MPQSASIARDSAPAATSAAFAYEPHAAPVAASARAELLRDPGFGRVFTDHMALARYSAARGWHDAKITARVPFEMHAASAVLHYAQEIFEGLKAYRQPDGGAALFRPEANAARFTASAGRMAMAPLPEALFVESCRALVRRDRDWIPQSEDGALYLRPFMIASEVFLGVKPSTEYLYAVIASSVGAYFKGDAAAVTLWVSQDYTRAAPGGTGAAKCGANYASSLAAQAEATRQGCDQVLFLDAVDRRWVEELGGMNIFFVLDDGCLVTPPLTGTILPGITRDTLLTLGRDLGLTVREERYGIDQVRADAASGRLREAFACGTAAVVTPIGAMKLADGGFQVGSGGSRGSGAGETTRRLHQALVALQRGHAPDPHGWRDPLF